MEIKLFGRGRALRVAVAITCQTAFVFFGYDQGVFSGIIGNPDWLDRFGHPNSSLEGIIVSIYNLGMFTGCIVNFIVGEQFGRRKSMWLAMAFVVIGASLQTSAFSRPHLMVARFITGVGTGIDTATTPVYQSELCDANIRGRLVSSEPLFVGVGIVIAYWFDYGMSFVGGSVSWRLPIACQMIFAFAVIIFVFGLPESPRWLYAKGKNREALQVLCDMYDVPPEDEKIQHEQNAVLEILAIERETGEYKWSQLLKRDEVQTGRRVLLAYGMQFMNQMGGINLVVYYVTSVLEKNVGLTRNLSLILGGCINTMFVLGSLVPTFFLDRLGRRRPMMVGSLGLAIRAAIGTSANALWNFFVVMITPVITQALPWQWPFVFMVLNFAFILLVYFCYPETANLTLEEMDLLFTRGDDDLGADKKILGRSTAVVRSLDRCGAWRKRERGSQKSKLPWRLPRTQGL
ncbi:hypothetical protein G7Y79_00090g101220 [Physcia stellaris]|nr:hypothetical protein G7Y79_00090g101220 [Physcia stellaris]